MNPLLIAHRGASRNAPENTLAAFRLAWEEGADGIEADFRLTRDGHVICLHDDTTGRVAGADLSVRDSTFADLRLLDVGSWKGACWAGLRIPPLPEVLAALPAGKKLFIELKSGAEIIPPLSRALAEAGAHPEQIRILAFSSSLIAEVKKHLPLFRACWLTDYRWWKRSDIWRPSQRQVLDTLRDTGADGLASHARTILDADFVKTLHNMGMEIHVWTVDRAAAGRRFQQLGVDSIMTNRPGWLWARMEQAGKD